jgi:predicted Zn-ribbon and HTH transcriptional regulator
MNCLRCAHEWQNRSDAAPKKCPKCQAVNWADARPDMVSCVKCGRTWQPRTGIVTKYCPGCKTKKWSGQTAPVPVRTPTPTPTTETQAQLDRFASLDVPADPKTCPKCAFDWTPRTNDPKKCPKCQARLDVAPKKEEARARRRAAFALAAVGPLADFCPDTGILPFAWTVTDWEGNTIGNTTNAFIVRDGCDRETHYPVFRGGYSGIPPELYGWTRRDGANL